MVHLTTRWDTMKRQLILVDGQLGFDDDDSESLSSKSIDQ